MSYQIKIVNVDKSFQCEEQENLLDAAQKANILLSYGCRSGLCGSCEGLIKSGSVNYPEGKPKGLTEEEIQQGKVLLCKAQATSDLNIEARVEALENNNPVRTFPVKIHSSTLLADDVLQLFLQLPSTEDTLKFKAGQWLYFVLKDGKKRAFSIANTANEDKLLELHLRHVEGGVFTDYVFNQLKVGDILKIEAPHGTFYYHEDYRELLMVAGGTGFAPIKGILEGLFEKAKIPKITLYWGVRTKKDLYMNDLVEQWVDKGLIKYIPVLSNPEKDIEWKGKTGFVHEVIEKDMDILKDFAIYMAGPPQMITACKSTFISKKAKNKNIYYDSFDYSDDASKAIEQVSEGGK